MSQLLTVITVVRNDLLGYKKTINSISRLNANLEIVIIDGSDLNLQREIELVSKKIRAKYINQPPRGIYQAMNLGLKNANGKYVIFMNSGDAFHPFFNYHAFSHILENSHETLLTFVVEKYDTLQFLRPKFLTTSKSFLKAPHQGIFYPRQFYEHNSYNEEIGISADGEFTHRSLKLHDGIFLNTLVSEFSLGGTSSTYSKFSDIHKRVKQSNNILTKFKLYAKYVLWKIVPQKIFYYLIGIYKYSRFSNLKYTSSTFDNRILSRYASEAG